jgi:MoaD family protein
MIPTALQQYAGKQESVAVDGATIQEILENLTTRYDGLRKHLFNEKGDLRSFVNVYVNDEDIRYQKGKTTAVKEGDVVSIVPAIAGGAGSSDRPSPPPGERIAGPDPEPEPEVNAP